MKKKLAPDQTDANGEHKKKRKQGLNLGDRFTNLVVTQCFWNVELNRPCRFSEVRCDCGTVKQVRNTDLRGGNTTSCGCKKLERITTLQKTRQQLRAQNPLTNKNYAIKRYLRWYKGNAQKRNIEWNLSSIEFKHLISQPCYYCGASPKFNDRFAREYTQKFKQRKTPWSSEIYDQKILYVNGIDRLDSAEPYKIENCVTCCTDCNYGKHIKTKQEFLEWIERVYLFNFKKPQ